MPEDRSQNSFDFAQAVIRWQVVHGRHGLPWQGTRDPYRVWLSEIMLQQTQVVTVLGYYDRFLARFPTVAALAAADQADVMALWSGLGYYSRARNLHACAQQVVSHHGGEFPATAHVLETLPGIGPSTAAAIASFCFGQAVSIFDGNVKRVLARFTGFEADLSDTSADRELRQIATSHLPSENPDQGMPRYTQGLMDLGATVCTRTKPACLLCPLKQACVAQRSGDPARLPLKTRRLVRRTVSWHLLLLQRPGGDIWLERRPSKGIWSGLYCPPVFASDDELLRHPDVGHATSTTRLDSFTHTLTHRDIVLHPVVCQLTESRAHPLASIDGERGLWIASDRLAHTALPTPVTKLLVRLQTPR